MRFPPATHVCRLVSCGLLTVVRVIAGPWFVVGDRCPHNKHKRSFAKMITPATAPPIVRSGHRRPGGCRSDHPQYQYGSKPIYCGQRIFPTTPTAEIRSPRHCWRQRQCIGTTVLPLATTTRVAMGPGSIRWPSGMSRKAGRAGTEPNDPTINRLEYEKNDKQCQVVRGGRWRCSLPLLLLWGL